MNTTLRVTQWAVERYVKDRVDSTAEEIAAGTGLSAGTVRRVALHAPDLTSRAEYRVSHSRDYPMMEHGHHKVLVYGPSREVLARLIRGLREQNARERRVHAEAEQELAVRAQDAYDKRDQLSRLIATPEDPWPDFPKSMATDGE